MLLSLSPPLFIQICISLTADPLICESYLKMPKAAFAVIFFPSLITLPWPVPPVCYFGFTFPFMQAIVHSF